MASIKKKKSGGGGANWMDTYGDMVPLLLCFFVLLYSMSTIDQEKWMMIVQSFNKNALVSTDTEPRGPDGDNAEEGGDDLPATDMEENLLDELYEFLATMAAESDGTISVSQGDGYIYLSFSNAIFFAGDKWDLLPAGREVLDAIRPALDAAAPAIDEIRVSGHTATAQGTYNVHWDFQLSTMRAVEVATYLLEGSEALDPARTIPEGYGQWRPITGNELESDRSQNRRVEMMITGKDLEDVMGDSLNQYYTITGHDQPEDAVTRYYTSQTAAD